jgi:N-acetylneuraminic acid mutarotase
MIRPPMSIVALTLGAFAFLSCSDDTAPTQPGSVADQPLAPEFAWASNSWQTRAPMPGPRWNFASGVVNNSTGQSTLYVFGGADDHGNVTRVEAYDYTTNSWTTKASQFERTYLNGTGVIGGKIYIAGGVVEVGEGTIVYKKTLVVYDPATDAFTPKADMPRTLALGVTGVMGGKLYVVGGRCGECSPQVSRRMYRYDPTTNAWSFLPWAPRAHLHGASGVINGKLYVAGGYEGTTSTSNLDVYDPLTNRWKALAPVPQPLSGAGGAVLNNKLYVVGAGASFKSVYAYDPATNTWATKAQLPTGRDLLEAATVTAFGNQKILAVGGLDPSTGITAVNQAYKP